MDSESRIGGIDNVSAEDVDGVVTRLVDAIRQSEGMDTKEN